MGKNDFFDGTYALGDILEVPLFFPPFLSLFTFLIIFFGGGWGGRNRCDIFPLGSQTKCDLCCTWHMLQNQSIMEEIQYFIALFF